MSLLNYAIKFGHVYHRWTKVVNVMLQKDAGNPRIHRLRVIHLYEADYNLLLAVKWRCAMYHAENENILNDGLYGSRPGRSAHDPAFMEILQNKIYRTSMKPGVNYDLDASSCYDRIVPNVAAICSRRVGMPLSLVRLNMATLEQARYHIKTRLGVSEGNYRHEEPLPLYGTGQGSGNSPILWNFVCSALFDALASRAHGAGFTSYDKQQSIHSCIVGFVDDCTQRVNHFDASNQPTGDELISLITQDVQLWNDLLWTSGGTLEQQKCSFHLIQSNWTQDGHPFLNGGTQAAQVIIQHQGRSIPTYQKSNYTSHKTLGCFINPAATTKQPEQYLIKKNNHYAKLLETNYFSRSEAWTYYAAFYLPSMTYTLPITPLTSAQCQSLDARLFRTLLPRCGYNRNMSRAIRHAPTQMGGAGFRPLYVEQGILMVQQIHKFLNSPTTTIGKLLRMTLSWTQAFVGTSQMILTDVNSKLPPVGKSYLLDVRSFLHTVNGKITMIDPPIPPKLRVNDRHIMDIALTQKQWTNRHLSRINACRRYLQAQTLADIATIQGTTIPPPIINGTIDFEPDNVRISTFNQRRPNKQAWKTWRRFLLLICTNQGVIRQPLGDWVVTIDQTRHWPAYCYNSSTDSLYSRQQGGMYNQHLRLRQGVFSIRTVTPTHHVTGYPTAVTITMDTYRPIYNFKPLSQSSPPPEMLHNRSIQVEPWERELLDNSIESSIQGDVLTSLIRKNRIISCSDGSARLDTGSFGFVISTISGNRIAKGKGPAPGAHSNSFRSEAYGVLATLRWLYHALPSTECDNDMEIVHYLDNQSVITRIEKARRLQRSIPNLVLLPESDVINAIINSLSELPIRIKFKWIKGHQDLTTPYDQLSIQAQLNCDADKQASAYTAPPGKNYSIVTPLPHTPSQLSIDGQSVTGHYKQWIREAASIPALHAYWCHTFHWSAATLALVDIQAYKSILTKYTNIRTTIVKHVHNISPTGKIAHRNNHHLPHECPACGEPFEDNSHVILCTHPTRVEWRQQTIKKLSHYAASRSDPVLLDILRDGLIRYHRHLDPIPSTSYPQRYSILIAHQTALGWDQVYKGRWSTEWHRLQNIYESKTTTHASDWIVGLGRFLIDQWVEVWKMRNEQRHGKDMESQSQLRLSILRSELEELYQYKSQVCPAEIPLFYESVDAHLRNHPHLDTIAGWVQMYRDAIIASANQATRLGLRNTRTLTSYPMFSPLGSTHRQTSLAASLPVS